ncbi:MAG TPA: hypothetical protein VL337_08350 [Acidimicrobiales bacterium]|jgi:hypothetical protein|nr:hypothetical protein [Acidimicrobiales bacterium]
MSTDARLMQSDRRRALRVSGWLFLAVAVLAAAVWVSPRRPHGLSLRFGPVVTVAKVLAFLGGVWCTWLIRGGRGHRAPAPPALAAARPGRPHRPAAHPPN